METNAIALGTFDGLHRGHLTVLQNAMGEFFNTIAITFKAPPKMLMDNKTELLLTSHKKRHALKRMGITPVELDFDEVKNLSPEEFLKDIRDRYNPSLISCGFNFRFGKNATGNADMLKAFCREKNIHFTKAEPVLYGDEAVSSTRIREELKEGNMKAVKAMLGRSFSFESEIIHGDARGRTIGFPTVNLVYPRELVTPRFGVYTSIAVIDNVPYKSITNIGIRPTFKTDYVISETHLIDFDGDVYGKSAKVILIEFLRDEVKFGSLEELKTAIERDKKKTNLLELTSFASDIIF